MSLDYGTTPDTPKGMTLTIYTEMDNQLSPPLNDAINNAQSADEKKAAEDALGDARKNWKKLSYAIATGVIEHIKSNMEIKKIKLIDKVIVNGDTGTASPSNHKHSVDINAENTDLEFTETDYPSGHGHVE